MAIDLKKTLWELRRGEILLGTLDHCDLDWPWLMCRFHAGDEFAAYRPLFVDEIALMDKEEKDDTARQAWEAAAAKISGLRLTLTMSFGSKSWLYRNFQLHIRDEEGWFRLYPDPEFPDLPLP